MGHRGQQILDDVVESRLVDLCQFRRRAADGDVALIGGQQAHPFAQLSLNRDLPCKGFHIHAVCTREPHDPVAKTDFDLGLGQFEDEGYTHAGKAVGLVPRDSSSNHHIDADKTGQLD